MENEQKRPSKCLSQIHIKRHALQKKILAGGQLTIKICFMSPSPPSVAIEAQRPTTTTLGCLGYRGPKTHDHRSRQQKREECLKEKICLALYSAYGWEKEEKEDEEDGEDEAYGADH